MLTRTFTFLLFLPFLFSCQTAREKVSAFPTFLTSHCNAATVIEPPTANDLIFRSKDGGKSWQDVSLGLPKDIQVWSFYAAENEIYVGTENGLYRQQTNIETATWEKSFYMVEKINQLFPSQSGLYVYNYDNGFFQEIQGTGIWKSRHNTLQEKDIYNYVETPDGFIFVSTKNGIFKSADKGLTWKHVFAEGRVLSVEAAGEVLIACGTQGVLRSTDKGEKWEWVMTEDGAALQTTFVNGDLFAITNGEVPWKYVLSDADMNRLLASSDMGKTWHRIDESLSFKESIFGIDKAGEYLYCSNDVGIFRSADRGKTWERVPSPNKKALFRLTVSGDVLYAIQYSGC